MKGRGNISKKLPLFRSTNYSSPLSKGDMVQVPQMSETNSTRPYVYMSFPILYVHTYDKA
jgi:hypothetical protein